MGALKWITGLIGWASGGPIGALLGYVLGSLTEKGLRAATTDNSKQQQYRSYSAIEQRNSFMVSLLVLSSAVIRADGKLLQSEMNYVKAFIQTNFGPGAVSEAMRILSELNEKNINIYSVGEQISRNMNYSQRLQLMHYLADLANADGNVCKQEKDMLEAIARAISISSSDAESIIAMFYHSSDSAYPILEISSFASNEEVKQAYRKMAMKYHPDKVATLGPDVQKAASEKFRNIQQAYETIKKERGIS